MNEITIEQKQEIYEHLLTLKCPDLLAALIAERSVESLADFEEKGLTLDDVISVGFIWDETPEGWYFWSYMYECLNADDVLPEVVETTDDYHILKLDPEYRIPLQTMPEVQPLDYEIGDVVKSSTGEILIAIGNNSNYVKEEPTLTFWQKIKFYAGRLFYKV